MEAAERVIGTSWTPTAWIENWPGLCLLGRGHFLGSGTDECVVQLWKRIETRRLLQKIPRRGAVTLGLKCLAQAVQVARVLPVGLFEFCDRFVIVLFSQGDSTSQFVRELDLQRIF